MAMSVAHRLTGLALYGGMLLLTLWLTSLAYFPDIYGLFSSFFSTFLGKIFLFFYTWVFFHHALGGLRHIVNDFGYGLEEARQRVAQLTLAGSILATVLAWCGLWTHSFSP
jgi:succinate dehydrogenase / fumarate reductase cytochrome b subunit